MKKIKVFGVNIPIKVVELESGGGQYISRKILIDPDEDEKNTRMLTIFHEAIHAALDIGGVAHALSPDMEEAIVRCIENGLGPLVTSGVFNTTPKSKRRRSSGR